MGRRIKARTDHFCTKKHHKSKCGCNSAFKAIKDMSQAVVSLAQNKITFPVELIDENNEYNPATSTFIPKQSGLYSITGSLFFTPVGEGRPYALFAQIFVNGVSVSRDTENGLPAQSVTLDTSTIVQLKAGDRVELFGGVNGADGNILAIPDSTRFEGFRIN